MNEYKLYFNERGHPLVYVEPLNSCGYKNPTLTVENYCKWYALYLVHPDGKVTTVDAEVYERVSRKTNGLITIWGDHVINPLAFKLVGELLGAHVDSRSMEMVIGRWEIEHNNKYDY